MTRFRLGFWLCTGILLFALKPIIPLEEAAPLPAQVAGFLLFGRQGTPVDLGDTLVLIPTAGAGRAIRRELAKKGVLSPQFRLPLEALLPQGLAVASRLEREAAWALLLEPTRGQRFKSLVPEVVPLEAPDDRFAVAARLCAVCDQLTEAGLNPASPQVVEVCSGDEQRWQAFGKLYAEYLAVLAKYGLRDPNEVRLAEGHDPTVPLGCRRLVVACIPDLAPIVETYLQSLDRLGLTVEVLAWSPSGQAAHLSTWGRADPSWWRENQPRVETKIIVAANDPPTEAGLLLDYAAGAEKADFEIFAAAPESAAALAQEIVWREAEAYLPEGRALARTESAEILLGWDAFARGHRWRDFRVLLQKPQFLSFFVAASGQPSPLTTRTAREACDQLIAQHLCESVEAARSWLKQADRSAEKADFPAQESLVATAGNLLGKKMEGQAMLEAVNRHRGRVPTDSFAARELAAVAEVAGQFADSPLLRQLPAAMREAASRADIMGKRIFPRAPDGAIEVQGWLEAPWSAARHLVIAGCREGALPSGTHDDSFLPDGAKKNLGLVTQDGRLARDSYLLSCLLASRPGAQVRLGFSRLGPQGEPNRPSRLLFGCLDSELPERSGLLLRPAPRSVRGEQQEVPFQLQIPAPDAQQWPPRSIRVTAFKNYLACPLRFYLGTILKLRKVDPDAREIPATDFGTVMHKVLEEFALDKSLAGLRDGAEIARHLSRLLDALVPRFYGDHPSPVVQVQIESMRARLVVAAATEAGLRADGWSTLEAEYKVVAADQCLLGGLAVTGTIDRIDVHPEHGLRILDYKTYSQPKNPLKTHLGPPRGRDHLPEADLETWSKTGRAQLRSWKELQLPLYAWLARKIWPEQAAKGVAVGYFLLPPDGEAGPSALEFFALTAEMQTSAERCAARIAGLVKAGQFWPPSPSSEVEFDDFKDWFGPEDPRKLIDEASADRLKGNP